MTDRRSFFKSLALGLASFSILPSALTYARSWKQVGELVVPKPLIGKWTAVPNPDYETAPLEVLWVTNPGCFTAHGSNMASYNPFPVRFVPGKDGELHQIKPFTRVMLDDFAAQVPFV